MVFPGNALSAKSPGSENVAPTRQNVRVKIETPTDHQDSPSAAALAKRSVAACNIQSPIKAGDKASAAACNGALPLAEAKNSPVKSIRSSPSKHSPSKINVLKF